MQTVQTDTDMSPADRALLQSVRAAASAARTRAVASARAKTTTRRI